MFENLLIFRDFSIPILVGVLGALHPGTSPTQCLLVFQ